MHWNECHPSFLAFRKEINYLEELHHFKVKDPNAFDHLANFKNRPKSGETKFHATGGHTEEIVFNNSSSHYAGNNNVKVLNSSFNHIIDNATTSQKMKNYLDGTGNKVYSKTTLPDGHFEYKNILFEMDPQPTSYNLDQWVLNGKVYEFKPKHTQYKASWTDDYIKHDMAFASKNKELVPSSSSRPNPNFKEASERFHGDFREWVETTYKSSLIDGTDVKIKFVNHHRYNLQTSFDNHYTYFEID